MNWMERADFDKPALMRYITEECIPTALLGLTGT
jgi:hypothetical protein